MNMTNKEEAVTLAVKAFEAYETMQSPRKKGEESSQDDKAGQSSLFKHDKSELVKMVQYLNFSNDNLKKGIVAMNKREIRIKRERD